jgi:hypothetical protein
MSVSIPLPAASGTWVARPQIIRKNYLSLSLTDINVAQVAQINPFVCFL